MTYTNNLFQKYINKVLKDYVDKLTSKYIYNSLVDFSKNLTQYQEYVNKFRYKMIIKLLKLDIDKLELEIKSTKYIGFIIKVEQKLNIDLDKIKAILEWESRVSVNEIRSFLVFAYFH